MQMISYKGFILRERANGSWDAINRTTGQWFNRPTQRGVKWAVSAYTRIWDEMATSTPRRAFYLKAA